MTNTVPRKESSRGARTTVDRASSYSLEKLGARGGVRLFDRCVGCWWRRLPAREKVCSPLPTWQRKLKKLRETVLEIIYYSVVPRYVPVPPLFTAARGFSAFRPGLIAKVNAQGLQSLVFDFLRYLLSWLLCVCEEATKGKECRGTGTKVPSADFSRFNKRVSSREAHLFISYT